MSDELEIDGTLRVPGATVEVVLRTGAPVGLTNAEVLAAISDATRAWDLECSTVRLLSAGQTTAEATELDGRTTVQAVFSGWAARGYRPEQAAITEALYVETEDGWEIADADILLNAETIHWGASGAPDLRAVLVHELGHVLGLGHSDADPSLAIMFAEYQSRAWRPRVDDVEGVCALYPPAHCPEVACGEGELCEDGRCIAMCVSGELCPSNTCSQGGEHEGMCVAPATIGAPCMRGDECESRLCLTSMRAGSYCTHSCSADADCAGMQACRLLEGRSVCAPLPPTSGCSVARGSAPSGPLPGAWWFVIASVLWIASAHRRARRIDQDTRRECSAKRGGAR